MSGSYELDAMELSALLCSRVCHDVISPVGAISNGLEVLDEDEDEEMRGHAMDLIRQSARQASAKLQFARLAFGAAGSAGAHLDLSDARDIVLDYAKNEKTEIEWDGPSATMGKDYVKLLLNMVLIGLASIPRGGTLKVTLEDVTTDAPRFSLRATGKAARIPTETASYLGGAQPDDALDARAAQPYFTGLVARHLGMDIKAEMSGDDFTLMAQPKS
ncbi:histidine phosphotransferase ChpT [Tepidicaulis sp. LMO-SS28]|uniref:histidine phosphotransferase ChpT n=1 Tax=Tepidicaulis sp. LMO-SS28 TaxID=3447455 RepID=UPI003EE314EA